jgi:hypothetical protein
MYSHMSRNVTKRHANRLERAFAWYTNLDTRLGILQARFMLDPTGRPHPKPKEKGKEDDHCPAQLGNPSSFAMLEGTARFAWCAWGRVPFDFDFDFNLEC